MKCKQAQNAISSYIDKLLSPSEQAKLNEHLEHCAECTSYMEDLTQGLAMLRDLPQENPSSNFEWNLKRKIAEAVAERRVLEKRQVKELFWPRFGLSAAAALTIILGSAWLLFSVTQERTPELPGIELPGNSSQFVGDSDFTPQPTGARGLGITPSTRDLRPVGNENSGYELQMRHNTINSAEESGAYPHAGVDMPVDSTATEENSRKQ